MSEIKLGFLGFSLLVTLLELEAPESIAALQPKRTRVGHYHLIPKELEGEESPRNVFGVHSLDDV